MAEQLRSCEHPTSCNPLPDHRPLEFRKIKTIADQVPQITVVTLNVPYRSNGIVRDPGRLHGCVPTDDVSIARLRLRWNQICLQPITLDQVSFDWNGPLQILGRKIHQAHPKPSAPPRRIQARGPGRANLTTMEFSLSDGAHLRRVRELHREAERLGGLEVGAEIDVGWRLLLRHRLVLHR